MPADPLHTGVIPNLPKTKLAHTLEYMIRPEVFQHESRCVCVTRSCKNSLIQHKTCLSSSRQTGLTSKCSEQTKVHWFLGLVQTDFPSNSYIKKLKKKNKAEHEGWIIFFKSDSQTWDTKIIRLLNIFAQTLIGRTATTLLIKKVNISATVSHTHTR